jgi:hypothetical protein
MGSVPPANFENVKPPKLNGTGFDPIANVRK